MELSTQQEYGGVPSPVLGEASGDPEGGEDWPPAPYPNVY